MESMQAMHEQEGGGKCHAGGKKLFADVRAKLFWRGSCFNTIRPDTKAAGIRLNRIYSVSCVHINCSPKNIIFLGSPQVFL